MTDFEALYTEHYQNVYRYVLSLCKHPAAAEDITQETFYKAMESHDTFLGNCRVFVWLCQIAKNTYFSLYRKEKPLTSEPEISFVSPTAPDFEQSLLDEEAAKKLHILLHQLSEPYKEVFTLRIFGELPFRQIGELFGKTDSWARLIFHRAKLMLRKGYYE